MFVNSLTPISFNALCIVCKGRGEEGKVEKKARGSCKPTFKSAVGRSYD